MIDPQVGVEFLKSIALLATGLLVYVGPFRSARVAYFRQCVFEIRNQLWDDLRQCGALNLPEHRRVRAMLNGLINIAPFLDLVLIVRLGWLLRDVKNSDPISTSIRSLTNLDARTAIERSMDRMAICVIRHIVLRTLPGCLVGIPFFAIYKTGIYRLIPWCARKAAATKRTLYRYVDGMIMANSCPDLKSSPDLKPSYVTA